MAAVRISAPRSFWRGNDPDAAEGGSRDGRRSGAEGFGEWASWPYFGKNILPILSLAEVGGDAELRKPRAPGVRGGAGAERLLLAARAVGDGDGAQLPGYAHADPWGGPALLWLYFGGATPKLEGDLIGAAVMDYAPPALIEKAAGDRSRPFTARAHFGRNNQVSYLNGSYGLFCEEQGDTVQDWWQSYPYGVMWDEPNRDRHDFLWLTAPMNDDKSGKYVVRVSHPHGIQSTAQSNLQNESALLYVFQFGPADVFKYALAFIPGGWLAMQDDAQAEGRVYLHYGSVLIAISSSAKFPWDRAAGLKAPSSAPYPGDSEFRVAASPLAMAIETARPDEVPGATPEARLAAFRDLIRAKTKIELVHGPRCGGPVHGPAGRRAGAAVPGTGRGQWEAGQLRRSPAGGIRRGCISRWGRPDGDGREGHARLRLPKWTVTETKHSQS